MQDGGSNTTLFHVELMGLSKAHLQRIVCTRGVALAEVLIDIMHQRSSTCPQVLPASIERVLTLQHI